MTRQAISRQGSSVILYDDSVVSHIEPAMFRRGFWPDADIAPGYSGGRGATLFVSCQGENWVVKHYYRGGMAGKVLDDGFLYLGMSRVRSIAEWRLLHAALAAGLPVPFPVAAGFERHGLTYTAGLITRRIEGVVPFSSRLAAGRAAPEVWSAVGACIRRFHDAGFYHADLSAHNLQIDDADNIWLLDWDKGRQRRPGNWRYENLARLQRSCRKISADGTAHFVARDWDTLLEGYGR